MTLPPRVVPALVAASALFAAASPACAQPPAPPAPPAPPSAPKPPALPEIRAQLQAEADRLSPLFSSPVAHRFLDATADLPDPGPRLVWRSADRQRAVTHAAYQTLTPEEKAGLTSRVFDARFYYTTGYGSPLIYARPLQIVAEQGFEPRGARVLDFGYGMIGQLRLLASIGADVNGVEVEPLFAALYAQPGDTGPIPPSTAADPTPGRGGTLALWNGRWPGDEPLAAGVGGGYDLFISKNVLKRGYIHPERPVDEKFLVKLGVSDEAFVAAMHGALKPGGLALIYNIAPPQNPEDKPYLPHADPRSAFPREVLEKAGFEVLAFDQDDSAEIIKVWQALDIFTDAEKGEPEKFLFAKYTLLRRRP